MTFHCSGPFKLLLHESRHNSSEQSEEDSHIWMNETMNHKTSLILGSVGVVTVPLVVTITYIAINGHYKLGPIILW